MGVSDAVLYNFTACFTNNGISPSLVLYIKLEMINIKLHHGFVTADHNMKLWRLSVKARKWTISALTINFRIFESSDFITCNAVIIKLSKHNRNMLYFFLHPEKKVISYNIYILLHPSFKIYYQTTLNSSSFNYFLQYHLSLYI